MSPEEREAREALEGVEQVLYAARVAHLEARRAYSSVRVVGSIKEVESARDRLAQEAVDLVAAEDAEQEALDRLNKILKGESRTYTEAQIRAVYDDSGFANTATGLIEALRSLAATPHIPGSPWPFPGETS